MPNTTRAVPFLDQGVLAFTITVLITLLQLKYAGNCDIKTPFESHPRAMKVAVVTSLLYYFTYGVTRRSFFLHFPPNIVTFTHHWLVCLGNLSVASLGSIFFADSVRPFFYVLCFMLFASEGLYRVYRKCAEELEELNVYTRYINIPRWFSNSWRFMANFSLEGGHFPSDRS